MLLKKLRIFFWISSCLARASWFLAYSSWSLALASLISIILYSSRWIYSIEELDETVVTREEKGLMPSHFTIPDFFLKTKFEISSCKGNCIRILTMILLHFENSFLSFEREKETNNHNYVLTWKISTITTNLTYHNPHHYPYQTIHKCKIWTQLLSFEREKETNNHNYVLIWKISTIATNLTYHSLHHYPYQTIHKCNYY